MAGIINKAVVKKIVFLPPAMRIKNVLGIRSVAPLRPAMDVSVKYSAWVNGNPRFSIWTVMIPQYNHTAKPHSRHGMETQMFLVAIELPVVSQNSWSSTFHSLMFAAMSPPTYSIR